MKSYTDIEQSRKLAEFLPIESADMFLALNGTVPVMSKYIDDGLVTADNTAIPCWSLAALMNLLPSEFIEKSEYSESTYRIDIRKYALTDDVDIYQIAYGSYKWYEDGSNSWKDMINTGEKEDLLDAAFEMICWLLKNKKL